MAWTPAQEEAISTRNCGLIVSAAAGSGKTSVLVERLIKLLLPDEQGNYVPADRMIVVTFTTDVAAEIKSRLSAELEKQIALQPNNSILYHQQMLLQSAHISTIHAFCFDLIRENYTKDGITSSFHILSEEESDMLNIKACDQVLNQWHEERNEDMAKLWQAFCESNDTPLETVVLELHRFLASVPYRNTWKQQIMDQLTCDPQHSVYHHTLIQQLKDQTASILQQIKKALELSYSFCQNSDNDLISWIDNDELAIDHVQDALQREPIEIDAILSPLQSLKGERQRKKFPSQKRSGIQNKEAYQQIKTLRDQYKEQMDKLQEKIETTLPYETWDFEQHRQIVPLLLELEEDIAQTIWNMKVEKNALSFDDAERLALDLLSVQNADGTISQSALATELSEYYQFIMIDEYQDSNNKQDEIFKLLSHNCIDPETKQLRYGDNIFMVGDMKQSIYGFRLANPQNFSRAIETSKDPHSLCHHIALTYNFRSTSSVLSFTNYICGNLMTKACGDVTYDQTEALMTGANLDTYLPKQEQAVQIAILHEPEDTAESKETLQMQYVIGQIETMMQEGRQVIEKDGRTRPCQYKDFCILFRDRNTCRKFVHALEEHNIPTHGPEEQGYLRAHEISILLDIMRILDNPHNDTSLAAVMLSPIYTFTPDDLLKIRMQDKEGNNLYVTLCRCVDGTYARDLSPALQEKCKSFYQSIVAMRQKMNMMPLEDFIRYIYDQTDFMSVMQLQEDGDKKRANLNLLLQYARQYDENTDAAHRGVPGFLHYIDWLSENDRDFTQTDASAGVDNAVSVMTMHKAKGLEFPFVFLGNLEHRFSNQDKMHRALFSDDGLIGFKINNPETYSCEKTLPYTVLEDRQTNASLSESLRLLYVAMTRAKQQLFIPLLGKRYEDEEKTPLNKYAMEISQDGTLPVSLVRSANSMADWIWMCLTLLHPPELGSLVYLPEQTWKQPAWSDNLQYQFTTVIPQKITEEEQNQDIAEEITSRTQTIQDVKHIISASFYTPDSTYKSQLSVTGLRQAHETQPKSIWWNRPRFVQESQKLHGAERGTAIHAFFQYVNFEAARSDFSGELHRLVEQGFLNKEQAQVITPAILTGFIQDPLYAKLKTSPEVLREKSFYVSCKDLQAYPELRSILGTYANTNSMLRGIIDLAFLEDDHYILVDYKTDYVTSPEELVTEYREQLMLYKGALSLITELPVTSCYIYSTQLQRSIIVEGDPVQT